MSLARTLRFIVNSPLNSDKKVGALIRYFKWQVGSRLVPGKVLVNWVNDSKIIVSPGETGLTGNVFTGLHEFQDMAFVLHALNDTDLFVDVGANVGSYTILACRAAGARGICFEPVPETYQRLRSNLAVNSLLERVQAFNQGVGDSRGMLQFTGDEGCMNHVLTSEETVCNIVEVPVISLDEELSEIPTMMKIDVEGYETMVLKGAHRILADHNLNAILVELNGSGTRYGFDEDAIIRTLNDQGYLPYNYDPWQRKLSRLPEKSKSSGNTLFIRDADLASQRVREAPRFHVLGKSV